MTNDLTERLKEAAEAQIRLGESTGADGRGRNPNNIYVIARGLLSLIQRLEGERDEAKPWVLFYRDGKTLGEVAAACGGRSVYDYSPWLTAPLCRADPRVRDEFDRLAHALSASQKEVERLTGALKLARDRLDKAGQIIPPSIDAALQTGGKEHG